MQTTPKSIKRHQNASKPLILVRFIAVTAASLTVGLVAAWILLTAWIAARASVTAPGPASSDELLALAAASLALAIVGWLVLGTALEVLSHVPGRVGRIAQIWTARVTPALARRIAAFVLGVGVGVAGGPTQAVASPRSNITSASIADPGFVPTLSAPDVPALDPGFTPTAATPDFTPAPTHPGFTPTAPRIRPQADPGLLGGRVTPAADREVVVHRGDTLWSIAAHQLGPQASDAEIAQAWPRWLDLNRGLIGDDPDLILPGQILRVPGGDTTASVH